MYKNQFIVAIKHDGKVLRELGDMVKLPFGSEFSILVKNLNSRRAKFTLHIDGADALDGTSIIVNANSEVEMKRFIRNGNMNEGNAFKFIERTPQIEDGPRGIRVDDGIVRVEFWYEKAIPQVINTIFQTQNKFWYENPYRTYSYGIGSVSIDSGIASSAIAQNSTLSSSHSISTATNATSANATIPLNDIGITVPGSKIEQKFETVYGFNPETVSQVIILRLVGKTAKDEQVVKAVTVKTKQKCEVCSHVNKSSAKFCSQCGASLELY